MAGGRMSASGWEIDFIRGEKDKYRATRLAFTRPQRPGFCWVTVTIAGREVQRPGLVARWHETPDGWMADVAWTDTDGAVHAEVVPRARLTAVEVKRAD